MDIATKNARLKPGNDGDPKYAKLELRCGVPYRLGEASEVGGVKCGSAGTAPPLPDP